MNQCAAISLDVERWKQGILNDATCSSWLRQAINDLERRDPADALQDLDLLRAFFATKYRGRI